MTEAAKPTQEELIARASLARAKNFQSMKVSDVSSILFADQMLRILEASEMIVAHKPTILEEFSERFVMWADERNALLNHIDALELENTMLKKPKPAKKPRAKNAQT